MVIFYLVLKLTLYQRQDKTFPKPVVQKCSYLFFNTGNNRLNKNRGDFSIAYLKRNHSSS